MDFGREIPLDGCLEQSREQVVTGRWGLRLLDRAICQGLQRQFVEETRVGDCSQSQPLDGIDPLTSGPLLSQDRQQRRIRME